MKDLKVILVDDHELYRVGVRTVIEEKLPNISIIAECSSGKELLVLLENDLIPDLVLLDIVMPEINGIEVAIVLREKYPDIKIIMLSSEVSHSTINELLKINVDGYLSKITVKEELANAINSVVEGSHFYGQDISKVIYDIYISKINAPQKKGFFRKKQPMVKLTEREREIIEMLCEGVAIKKIAEKLNISSRTISNHKANIMQKLGFHSTIELVKYAIREGIIII